MKVYVVCKVYDYEGEALDSAHSTKEKALARVAEIDRCRKLPITHDDNIYCDAAEWYEEEVL